MLTAFARAAAQKDRIAALPLPSREALVANRKPPVVALAAPASSKSIFKGGRPRGSGQCGGGGQGDGRAAVQGRADSSGHLKALGPLQWIGIIGVHSHLFDSRCRGGHKRWSTLVASAFGLPVQQPAADGQRDMCPVRGCSGVLDDEGHHRAACTGVLGGHWKALHDQFQNALHGILRRLPGVSSCIDKTQIPTHGSASAVGTSAAAQFQQGDIYFRLPDQGHLARLCGSQELVIDVICVHTHAKDGRDNRLRPGNGSDRPMAHLQSRANQKYTKHTPPYQRLHIAFLPVVADTAGRLHEDAVRLLYHVATIQATGNVDNEGLIGRARQDHRFGYRRASIFRRLQADLGLLLAALGAQQRHAPAGFSFLPPRPRRS